VFVLTVIALFNLDRLYTSVTFLLTAGFILLHLLVFRSDYLGRFYLSYIIVLVPFFIVNGILTGSFIEDQVVWYDDTQNLGVRMFTIPVEDSIYGMLLIMMNVTFLETFRKSGKVAVS
jgi:lycopene cyclase domain-containing protein